MNLKFHLLLHITLVAFVCLVATALYVLYQAEQQTTREIRTTAESIGKQLELQLLRIDVGFERADQFPDLDLWEQTRTISGVCIRFASANNSFARNICHGMDLSAKLWPMEFEKLYRLVFNPGLEVLRQISFNGQVHGSISVTPSAGMELARAWESVVELLRISAITVLAVCLLVYITSSQAFRPAQVIIAGLEKMRKGDLSVRLPAFELIEWQRTGAAINELAVSQQQLLSERKRLAMKLMMVQEQERRYLARELHDELGQCLTAVNATAASIAQTAKQECPVLVPEAEKISHINQRIMDTVRALLVRLRPTEIDELGLTESLRSLITEWNSRNNGSIYCRFDIDGDCNHLPEPLPVTLFRIVQECLTNVAKHSTAKNASVKLELIVGSILLTVKDNGNVDKLPFTDNPGIGLIGMRERVTALDGQMNLGVNEVGGLVVRVKLPVQPISREQV